MGVLEDDEWVGGSGSGRGMRACGMKGKERQEIEHDAAQDKSRAASGQRRAGRRLERTWPELVSRVRQVLGPSE